MSKRARRIIIPLLAALGCLGVLWVVFNAPNRRGPSGAAPTSPTNGATQPATQAAQAAGPTIAPPPDAIDSRTLARFASLRAVAPAGASQSPPQPLGSLDFRRASMQLDMTRVGAGIAQIAFSDIWETAEAKRKADTYRKRLRSEPFDPTQVDESQRYVLQQQQPFAWGNQSTLIPILAAHSAVINGTLVSLFEGSVWSEAGAGRFETTIVDQDGKPVAQIIRQHILKPGYGLVIVQQVENVSGQPLDVKWQQYGPLDLRVDQSGYNLDRRRFAFGYLANPGTPREIVLSGENDIDLERGQALKRHNKAVDTLDHLKENRDLIAIWPNSMSTNQGYDLCWFASANRYFALAIHPVLNDQGEGNRSLSKIVDEVRLVEVPGARNPETLFTFLVSPIQRIEAGQTGSFDMGVYAGPLDRVTLSVPPYRQLAMRGLIIYQVASCCTFLTFQWLANLLLWLLSSLHAYVFRDWGLAIIALVIFVRALLHPLTKKSQVNMQRFGKKMAALKPEIDKIQKKYAGDPRKAQQEQMKMMRERGINPLQMLGCLPMFLQMPIWIALWAVLYLAFELRQQPAFYGIFQLFNNWSFLGDLSSQDHFINLPWTFTIPLLNITVSGINLLPLLMGVVFYIQQKYMSPPTTPNMTPEQIQQQKIMKVMMVVMFPLFLYTAPSGLTLYIFTSTCIGILESRYIRKHVDQMDVGPVDGSDGGGGPGDKPKKPKDWRSRLFADALERAKAKREAAEQRSFKKRK